MVKITKEELNEYIDIAKREEDHVNTYLIRYVSTNEKIPTEILRRRYVVKNLLTSLERINNSDDSVVFIDYKDLITINSYKNNLDSEENTINMMKRENKTKK